MILSQRLAQLSKLGNWIINCKSNFIRLYIKYNVRGDASKQKILIQGGEETSQAINNYNITIGTINNHLIFWPFLNRTWSFMSKIWSLLIYSVTYKLFYSIPDGDLSPESTLERSKISFRSVNQILQTINTVERI